jgi:hypothetical protein
MASVTSNPSATGPLANRLPGALTLRIEPPAPGSNCACKSCGAIANCSSSSSGATVKYLTPFIIQFWTLASPAYYSSSMVPERYHWLYGILWRT